HDLVGARLGRAEALKRKNRAARPRPGPGGGGEGCDSAAPHRAEAVRAVDGLAVGGTERDARLAPAAGARRAEHLPEPAAAAAAAAAAAGVAAGRVGARGAIPGVIAAGAGVRAAAVAAGVLRARSLAAGTAGGATPGLREALFGVEGLFPLGEGELHPAIGTG